MAEGKKKTIFTDILIAWERRKKARKKAGQTEKGGERVKADPYVKE